MAKNKKYKYNITFYKGALDNISNKLIDFTVNYNTEDIFKAIETTYSNRNMINTTNEEQTKIRQDELNKKEKERLDNIETMTEQEKDELYEKIIRKNKKDRI